MLVVALVVAGVLVRCCWLLVVLLCGVAWRRCGLVVLCCRCCFVLLFCYCLLLVSFDVAICCQCCCCMLLYGVVVVDWRRCVTVSFFCLFAVVYDCVC